MSKRRRKHKWNPSLHQKQMRFWSVTLILFAAAMFGALMYLINRLR